MCFGQSCPTTAQLAGQSLLCVLLVCATPQANAQESPPRLPGLDPAAVARWPLETVTLQSGKKLHGLVSRQAADETEIVEVVQPPGRPMYLVVRPLETRQIAQVDLLPDGERAQLRERIAQFRGRALIEAARREDVHLTTVAGESTKLFYRGPWFTLISTADDAATRRSVVRIDQLFRAYRQILPPRVAPDRPLEIWQFGAMDQYHAQLRAQQLQVESAAFFDVRANRIMAGSDLLPWGVRWAATQARHDEIQRSIKALNERLPAALNQLSAELRQEGIGDDEIARELNALRGRWESESQAKLAEIAAANRRNEAYFAELTQRMFTRLGHESFHAYLDNFVYPSRTHAVPRWLHEGLAQVFESGRLEADALRVDAPERSLLARFKAELAGPAPMTLHDLLTAEDASFLVTHAGRGASQRHYLYSWALAYYLAFYERVLGTPRLDEYVARDAPRRSPQERFERLVGTPLAEFEARWTRTLRELP